MRILTPLEIRPTVSVAGYSAVPNEFVLGPRELPRPDLVYVAEGLFSFKAEGEQERRLTLGDMLFVYPGELHTIRRLSVGRAVAGFIHNEPVRDQTWAGGTYQLQPAPRRVTHTGNDPDLRDLFRRAASVFRGYGAFRKAILEGIVREIWLRLAEYWSGRGEPHLTPRMKGMVGFLRAHLLEPVGRTDLADKFHLTPEHVNFLFKKELGVSPIAFVTRERIHRAYNLIHEEGLTVKEVSSRVGFNDPFYFSRTFKRIMGIAPSEVR